MWIYAYTQLIYKVIFNLFNKGTKFCSNKRMDEIIKNSEDNLNLVTELKTSGLNTDAEGHIVIPVIQEDVVIDKKVVETGKVRILKTVTEQQETIDIPLVQEDINIERIPINQYVEAAPPGVRYEGEVTIIAVVKEVLVVEKRLLLVEEVRVTKNKVQTNETQEVSLRTEDIRVERINTGMQSDIKAGDSTI